MKIELSKYNFKAERKDIEAFLNSISGNNIEKLKNDFKNNQLDFELFVEEKKLNSNGKNSFTACILIKLKLIKLLLKKK